MHIGQVTSWSEGPRYTTVEDLPPPSPSQLQLRVLAAGLHQVVRSRASGTHYSARELPHTVGVDCVGLHEPTGRLYYALSLEPGFGTFAEFVNVARASAHPLPEDDGKGGDIDPVRFAASLNPAMSSWMALTQRTGASPTAGPGTTGLPPNFTALILGATSASGRLAARCARELGAGRVVGVARDGAALERLTLSHRLDEHVVLRDPVASTDYGRIAATPDVILDYVYGEAAVHLLSSLRTRKPVQYVGIGGLSGQREVAVPSALLRSGDITIRGAAPGAWRLSALERELPALVARVATWELAEAQAVPLRDIEEVWNDKEVARKGRVVFVP